MWGRSWVGVAVAAAPLLGSLRAGGRLCEGADMGVSAEGLFCCQEVLFVRP